MYMIRQTERQRDRQSKKEREMTKRGLCERPKDRTRDRKKIERKKTAARFACRPEPS